MEIKQCNGFRRELNEGPRVEEKRASGQAKGGREKKRREVEVDAGSRPVKPPPPPAPPFPT